MSSCAEVVHSSYEEKAHQLVFSIKHLLRPALNLKDIKSAIFKVQAGILASSLAIYYFYSISLLKANSCLLQCAKFTNGKLQLAPSHTKCHRVLVLPGHKHKHVIFYISVLSEKKNPHLA